MRGSGSDAGVVAYSSSPFVLPKVSPLGQTRSRTTGRERGWAAGHHHEKEKSIIDD